MGPIIRNISDTARWTATYRARESERADALFRDPFAARLAGERGESIRQQMAAAADNEWAFVIRTFLFDRAIQRRIEAGVRTVVNLAAGLDARPYRMDLPKDVRWVELDLPELFEYKNGILTGELPRCPLERIGVDLANRRARQYELDRRGGKGLAITEGLLVYLSEEEVADLGKDLAAAELDFWLLDLGSPALIRFLQATTGRLTAEAGAPLRFGPRDGVAFFEPLGWKPLEVESVFEEAMKLGRVPKELLAAPPPPPGPDGPIWSGVVLLERSGRARGESAEGRD